MLATDNPIYIIGSGAIGKALAVFLKLSGRNVTIVRGSVNDGSLKTENILVEMAGGAVFEAETVVRTMDSLSGTGGIFVLCNKSFGNEQLALLLKNKMGNPPVVLLQNGLGVEEPFVRHGFSEIYRCVLFVTSQVIGEGNVRFKPVGVCPVGIERGDPGHLDKIVQQLNTPYFAFRSEGNIRPVVWKKAIVNCVFNSICPLLDTDNGIFHRNQEALQIARRVIGECLTIATEKGIRLTPDEIEENLLQISRFSDGQLISTLQDIRNGRRTEIETLNLEVVRLAKELGKLDAVQETRLLGELVRLKAELALRQAGN
ncbi:2-dehydropantoate 2-reductase [Dyadobacter sp. 676]|uniref:2-dehydropantoate 2-reductase n=1 Tax=Dyadobacter sp. 676 TaxID=3088362 RepID=A0AAU8FJJ4_9BACT